MFLVFSAKQRQVKMEGREKRGVRRTTGHYLLLQISLEHNGVLSQSALGAPFVSMLQTMYLANVSQNFSRKRGKFSGIRAKAFRKRSVILTPVEIRSLEVVFFKIEVLFEALSVIMRRWGKTDHLLV